MTEYLTTKELATLLRIKERKVYDLAATGQVPCFKATGKLLFPRDAINAWLAEHRSGVDTSPQKDLPNVFLGSHDPLLDWSLRESQCGIATYFDGSEDGLTRFRNHEGAATGLHLYDADADDWNLPAVKATCGTMSVVLVEWVRRQRGLIISTAMKDRVRSIEDLKGLRIAPRQTQSGAQAFFLHLLARSHIDPLDLEFSSPARTEGDAALLIADGKADVAFGLLAMAEQYQLPFIPMTTERFDLLIHRRLWFEPALQCFFNFCHTDIFKARAGEFAGYDISGFGAVRFNGP